MFRLLYLTRLFGITRPMESIIHVRTDKTLHIATKVAALRAGKSMNQFIVDLLLANVNVTLEPLADWDRVDPPKIGTGPGEVMPVSLEELNRRAIEQAPTVVPKEVAKKIQKNHNVDAQLCKGGHIADEFGRCMQRGCKYSRFAG